MVSEGSVHHGKEGMTDSPTEVGLLVGFFTQSLEQEAENTDWDQKQVKPRVILYPKGFPTPNSATICNTSVQTHELARDI